MIRIIIIYAIVTIALAFVDYVRIRQQMGKIENINHNLSVALGLASGAILLASLAARFHFPCSRNFYIGFAAGVFAMFLVRVLIYDPSINLLRGLPIAYESTTTSSWVDQHIKLSFWQKRALAVAGLALLIFLYYKL